MAQPDLSDLTVGILGGTGAQGLGLGYRWAAGGLRVLLGSRDADRADRAAAELRERSGSPEVRGAANLRCASASDAVLVAVPFTGHRALLESLREALGAKIVIDCVNPLGFDRVGPYPLTVPEGSAAQQAAAVLAESRVTAAFHHVSAVLLANPEVPVNTDVLVLGDDRDAAHLVCALAEVIPGVRGLFAGGLRHAHHVEALTATLITLNKRYCAHTGLRITDLPPRPG